ncbi:hypothetical protein SIPHO037v1_p0003 [Vibrio phage 70E35.2]|nr:hypothetical protein SIPHO037v1_p0003 [Vibrio phage 70E35.2]
MESVESTNDLTLSEVKELARHLTEIGWDYEDRPPEWQIIRLGGDTHILMEDDSLIDLCITDNQVLSDKALDLPCIIWSHPLIEILRIGNPTQYNAEIDNLKARLF